MDLEKMVIDHERKIGEMGVKLDDVKKDTEAILSRLENGLCQEVHDHEKWIKTHDKKTKRRQQIYDKIWAAIVIYLLLQESGAFDYLIKAVTGG